ncbi:MAG: biopolymer transporter ExbD [Nitrospirae bacterium GWC2_57_9]|nr:MAG: biopolymer transporter ExbD [Nitrospirae bacterium GWC2_57_9]
MRGSRRMKRMERNNKNSQIVGLGLNLIPMMDVLTVLVFFLLFHSFNGDMPEARITLPHSIVETRPRETVAIVVTPEVVLVQGEAVVSTSRLIDDAVGTVPEVTERLRQLEPHLPKIFAENKELTLLADKTIQFKVLKKIMSTCTAAGYGRISLAVAQKAAKKI